MPDETRLNLSRVEHIDNFVSQGDQVSTLAPDAGEQPVNVVVIDASVADPELLLKDLSVDTKTIFVERGGLTALEQALRSHGRVDDLHIVTHGAPGGLLLGGEWIDAASLSADHRIAGALRTITGAGSKIALWACQVAKSDLGSHFLDKLAGLTGAAVFAADKPVGAASGGGTWDIGTAAPFSKDALAVYPHTLPTFDMTGGSISDNSTATPDFVETESGVTMTVTFNFSGAGVIASVNAGGVGGTADEVIFRQTGTITSVTVTFSQAVDISSFQYWESDNTASSGNYVFTPNTGTAVTITEAAFTSTGGFDGATVSPTDWTGITSFTITTTALAFSPGLDTIQFTVTPPNSDPTISGAPTDISVTEETLSNVDLSSVTLADADGDTLTATLTLSEGVWGTPADGNVDSVTETRVSDTVITLVGTAANINTYLDTASNLTYTSATDDVGDNAATLDIDVSDGNGGTANADSNIDVTNVNDDPTVSGLVTDIGFTEDTAGNVNLSAATFADVDSATVTVTLTASEGSFGTPADGAGVGSGVTETRVNDTTITLVGAPADINTYLDTASNITWTPAQDDNGGDTSTFTVTANDGDGSGNVALGTVNADVTAVNDDPTISGLVTDITVTEETAGDVDLSASSFSDVDSAGTGTVTLTASAGVLASSSGGGVMVSGSGTGTLTLSGTFAAINTFLDTASNVQYTGATDASGDNAATISVTANDDDGSGDVALGTVNIDITNVNDDPTISGLVTDIGFTEDTAGNVNLSAATFADVDSATVTVTLTASEGSFGTPADGAGVGSGVTETRVNDTTITLVGAPADINTYLDTASNITWTPAQDDNGGDTSTFTVTANDGDGSGNVALGTVNADVTAVNDDPTVSGLVSDITVTEETSSDVDLSAADFNDVDSAGTVIVTLTASSGTLNSASGGGVTVSGSGTGTLTLSGTFGAIEGFLDTAANVQYVGATDAAGNDAATISVTANDDDGSGDVALGTVNVDITNVNDDPTLTGLVTDVTVDEDTASDVDLSAATFADVDSAGDVTLTLTTSDGGSILEASSGGGVTVSGSGTGTLTLSGTASNIDAFLNTASNVQYTTDTDAVGDDIDAITITANDGDGSGNVALGSVNIDSSGVNDAPEFSDLDDTPTFTEGGSVVQLDADVEIEDIELDSLNSDNGDYSGALLSLERNGGASADDSFSVVSGGNLTVVDGPDGGGTISAGGNVIAIISDMGDDDELEIVFVDNGTTPTLALVEEVMQAIRYSNTSEDPDASVQIDWTFNDGNSGDAQGSGDNPGTGTGSITVTINGVEDAPTVSGLTDRGAVEDTTGAPDFSGVTIADTDTAGNITVTITATDTGAVLGAVDGAGVGAGVVETASGNNVVTLVGTAADITTYLSNASAITYTSSLNRETNDTISIQADDGVSTPNAASTATIVITPVNDLPTASDETITINEDTSHTFAASDFNFADVDTGAALASVRIDTLTLNSGTLQLSGVDVSATDVIAVADINAGNLVFVPDADDFGDGLLTFTFSVNDGTGFAASTSTMTIDVTDVADNAAPTGISLSDSSFSEDVAGAAIGTLSATDADGDEVSFSVLSDDRFIVDSNNVLRLADDVSFDFETQTTPLTVEVQASDGEGGISTRIFPLTITDVAEPQTGSNDDDTLSGDDDDDRILAGGGNDTLTGGQGDDTLRGDDGDDVVSGGDGDDVSFAGPTDTGNDTVEGNNGNDVLGGGGGNDVIVGGDLGTDVSDTNPGACGDDILFGGDGDDLLVGGSYNTQTDTVFNTGGSNQLWAGDGNDTVYGDTGNDVVGGGSGADVLNGGDGNDIEYGGPGDDSLFGGGGDDTLLGGLAGGSTSNDTLRGGNGDDLILASVDDDVLFGEDGNDTLFGGAGDDTVDGGNGNDVLWAGGGNDDLTGGPGADTFTFGSVSGNDTVTDFGTGADTLDLRFASTDFASVAEVQAAATNTTQGGQSGVLIDLGDGDSVFVVGLTVAGLTASTVTV